MNVVWKSFSNFVRSVKMVNVWLSTQLFQNARYKIRSNYCAQGLSRKRLCLEISSVWVSGLSPDCSCGASCDWCWEQVFASRNRCFEILLSSCPKNFQIWKIRYSSKIRYSKLGTVQYCISNLINLYKSHPSFIYQSCQFRQLNLYQSLSISNLRFSISTQAFSVLFPVTLLFCRRYEQFRRLEQKWALIKVNTLIGMWDY